MMAKFAAVAFYFGQLDRTAFRDKFATTLDDAFPAELAWLKSNGLMHETTGPPGRPGALGLTAGGAKHGNGVIALFFAPAIQRYLIDRDPQRAEDMHRARHYALKIAGGSA